MISLSPYALSIRKYFRCASLVATLLIPIIVPNRSAADSRPRKLHSVFKGINTELPSDPLKPLPTPQLNSQDPVIDCNRMADANQIALSRGIFLEPYTRININQWGEIALDPTRAAINTIPLFQLNSGENLDPLAFGFTEFALIPVLRFKPTATGVFRITIAHQCPTVYDFHTIEVVGPNVTYPVMVPAWNTVEMAATMNSAFYNRNAFGLSLFQYRNQDGGHALMSIIGSLVEPLQTWMIPLSVPFVFELSNASVRAYNNFTPTAFCFDQYQPFSYGFYVGRCNLMALQNRLFLGPSLDFYNTLSVSGPMALSPGLAYGMLSVGGHDEGAASGSEIGALDTAAYALSLLPLDSGLAMLKKAILSTWLSDTLRQSQQRAVASGKLSDVYHISLDREFTLLKVKELAEKVTAQNLPTQMRGTISDFETRTLRRSIKPESKSTYIDIFGSSKVNVNVDTYSVITINPLDDVIEFTVNLRNSYIPNLDGSENRDISNWNWEVLETENSLEAFTKNVDKIDDGVYHVLLVRTERPTDQTQGGRITFAFRASDSNQRQVPPYFLNLYSEYTSKATNNYELQFTGGQSFRSLLPRIKVSGLTNIPLSKVIRLNNSSGDFSGAILTHSYYGPDGYQNSALTWIDRGLAMPLSKTEKVVFGQPIEVTYKTVSIYKDSTETSIATLSTADTSERPAPALLFSPRNHLHTIRTKSQCDPTEFKWFVEHTTLPRSQVAFELVSQEYQSRVAIINEGFTRKVTFDSTALPERAHEILFSISDGTTSVTAKLVVQVNISCYKLELFDWGNFF